MVGRRGPERLARRGAGAGAPLCAAAPPTAPPRSPARAPARASARAGLRAALGIALGLGAGLAPGWSQQGAPGAAPPAAPPAAPLAVPPPPPPAATTAIPVQPAPQIVLGLAGEAGLRAGIEQASLLLRAEAEGLVNPQDLIAAARADYTRIVGRLYSEGYYGPVVSILVDGREAAEIPPFETPARIARIEIRVEAGPPYRFGRAEIAPLAPGTDLPEGFAPGGRARTALIREATAESVSGWREAGRAVAEVDRQSIVADYARAALDVSIAIRPGPVVRFGALSIQGNERVRTERIRRIAGFPSGDVFDPEELDLVQTRLRRTGAFRSVALAEAEALGPGDTLDIGLTVIEELPRRFGFGAEVATDVGLSTEAFWLHRNLFGGAERLRVSGAVSGIGARGDDAPDYRLTTRFDRPATFDPDTDLTILGEVERIDDPGFRSDILRAEVGAIRYATPDLTLRGAVQLRYSDTQDEFGRRQFRHVAFPLQATQDKRDDALNPTGGYFADLAATPYVGVGDSASGARLYGDGRLYFGLGAQDRIVLAGRVQAGSVLRSALDETPPDYLFFSGGGGSVRGQPYQSLGVPRGEGFVGGRSFLGVQSEVRGRVTERIGLVGFLDYGVVGDGPSGGQTESHAGAGLGVRYQTGIGPIRFDLAGPVAGDTGSGLQLYLGIGQAF